MLRAARKHYRLSALIARRAVREAVKVRKSGVGAVATVVATHQVTQAIASQNAVAEMLAEQAIDEAAEALLNPMSFTTSLDSLASMLAEIQVEQAAEFERLVESIVQDAGRAAESVSIAVRPDIAHIRYLSPPSCARCVVLAGRVYRYSTGFERHTNCDCVTVPVSVASTFADAVAAGIAGDPADLLANGQVRGLSKADTQAILDGADFGQVVNVRRQAAGLRQPGRVLSRRGRPTPEAIYRTARTRDEAVQLLAAAGYIR